MGSELHTKTVEQIYEFFAPRQRVIEIGCREINGGIRHLFRNTSYLGIDILPGPEVDIVADATSWKPDFRADMVICISVFEHTPWGREIVNNAASWLTDDGVMVLEAAHIMKPHSPVTGEYYAGEPTEWYRNITQQDYESWLHMFPRVKIWKQFRGIWAVASKDRRYHG